MKIAFYFDPSCPFSWITSRWLLVVQSQVEDLEIAWKPFALAIKNGEILEDAAESEYAKAHRESLRVLRVMQAAEVEEGANLLQLYTEFGTQKHIMFEEYTDEILLRSLENLGLPQTLLKNADSKIYDDALSNFIHEATEIVGKDIGVPTIVFTLNDGQQIGYFGPVLQSLPSKEDSLKIWNGLSNLATTKEFFELKRNRPAGNPDTPSTARC
jgi:hypothetical protein